MKIGIDISQIIYGTGVSVYTKNLVKNLLEIDKDNEYVFFGGSLRRKKEFKKFTDTLNGNFTTRFFRFPPSLADFFWNRLHFPKVETFVGKVDVFHSSDWAEAPSKAFNVTTVHDLTPFKFPKLTPSKVLAVHKRKIGRALASVDRVIVPSNSTKDDLVKLGFEKDRIRVIYEAASPVYKRKAQDEVKKLKRKYKITKGYLLAVGTSPRKNLNMVIKAYERVRAGHSLKLIVVGGHSDKEEYKRGIRFVGHVNEDELATLYSGAEALVYPSFYEGFGLPIIEAFSCGCPVVASNNSSIPEVAGDAAVLVDPANINSVVKGIEKALKEKQTLRKKGLKRAKDFSWKKTAEETLSVYMEAK